MTVETLQINVINAAWAGASGAATDIDEPIGSPDTAYYGPGPDGDAADFGFTASAVVDGDVVTNISFNLIYRDDGTASNLFVDVDLLIGGVVQGTTQRVSVSGSDATYNNINHAGWNVDRTAAEMDGAELRLTPQQTGMPGTNVAFLETANMVVTYAAPPVFKQAGQRAFLDSAVAVDSLVGAAAENANYTLDLSGGDAFLIIRTELEETAGSPGNPSISIYYQVNGGGYSSLGAATTDVQYNTGHACTSAHGTTLGDILTTSAATFNSGGIFDNIDDSPFIGDFDGSDVREYALAAKFIAAELNDSDTVNFRWKDPVATWDNIITITISKAGSTTFFETLAATTVGSAGLSRTPTFVEALAATAIGVAALSTLTTWFRTLAATAVGAATLLKKTSTTLGATAVGSATLAAATLFTQALTATATGVAGLLKTTSVTLAATTVAAAALIRKISITLGATALGTAGLLKKTSKTLAATALGSATLVAATLFTKTLAATASVVAGLAALAVIGQTLAATAIGVASLATVTTWFRTLAATAVGVTTLTKGMFVTMAATALGTAALLKKTSKTFAAQAVGVAGLAGAAFYEQALAAVAVGVAALTGAYTAAAPVVINTWRWLAMRLGI